MFFRTPFILPLLYPGLIWKVPTTENKIYLTFDDGPVPGPTNFVLDQLKAFDAKATFFCIGKNVNGNVDLFNRIKGEGHRIGNHTFQHLKGWSVPDDTYIGDVEKCQQVIGKTNLFRPPYGRVSRSQLRKLNDYKIVMWDVLSYDYAKSISQERCLKGVIKAVRLGSIVVFHDSYKAERNMQYALPRVLDHFANRNFVFESLSELDDSVQI